MGKDDIETFQPSTKGDWRQWLEKNHRTKQAVWLVYHKKKTGSRSLSWSEAVDEALCFGWIDSTAKSIDDEKYKQFFCPRKPKSVWSKINKEKVARLIEAGLMTPAGYESIELAKQNGSWNILDEVEELKIPKDLEIALNSKTGAMDYFLSLSTSVRKMMLYRLALAKRTETRQKRIDEIALSVFQNMKQKPF